MRGMSHPTPSYNSPQGTEALRLQQHLSFSSPAPTNPSNTHQLAVAEDLGGVCRHLLERLQRILSVALLPHPHRRIQHQDEHLRRRGDCTWRGVSGVGLALSWQLRQQQGWHVVLRQIARPPDRGLTTHDDEWLDEGARPRLLRVILHQRKSKGHCRRQQQDLHVWGE